MSHLTNDNIPSMVLPPRSARALFVGIAVAVLAAGCGGGGLLGKEYEYEEQLQLNVDGSARIELSASIPALVTLRGLELDPDPSAEINREQVRALFAARGVEIRSVRLSRRNGRRFVHVRLDVDDVRELSRVPPFSWSTYEFRRRGEMLEYKQVVGASAGKSVSDVGWDGSELVAFRMHIPSVIAYHNAPSKEVRRGNILEWEQPLTERVKGIPVEVEVTMEPESILYTTLLLFGSTIVLAAAAFGIVIWRVARHGHKQEATSP